MLKVKGHLWIETDEGTVMGVGRMRLLEALDQQGSISAAARAVGMSYRQAWELVDSMNRHAGTPLVSAATGGQGGGGAKLTDHGRELLEAYRLLLQKFHRFNDRETEIVNSRK